MYAYEFSRKKLSRIAAGFVWAWALDFVLRVVLYVTLGDAFYLSTGNRILAALSGVFAGCAATLMIIRAKSSPTKVPDETGTVE